MAEPTNPSETMFLDSHMNLSRALKRVARAEVAKERRRLKEQNRQTRALERRFPELKGIHPYLLSEVARLQDQYDAQGHSGGLQVAKNCRTIIEHWKEQAIISLTNIQYHPRRVKRAVYCSHQIFHIPLDRHDPRGISEWKDHELLTSPNPAKGPRLSTSPSEVGGSGDSTIDDDNHGCGDDTEDDDSSSEDCSVNTVRKYIMANYPKGYAQFRRRTGSIITESSSGSEDDSTFEPESSSEATTELQLPPPEDGSDNQVNLDSEDPFAEDDDSFLGTGWDDGHLTHLPPPVFPRLNQYLDYTNYANHSDSDSFVVEDTAGDTADPFTNNAGSVNAGSTNAGSENAGSTNAGSENAGSVNAGSVNAGSTNADDVGLPGPPLPQNIAFGPGPASPPFSPVSTGGSTGSPSSLLGTFAPPPVGSPYYGPHIGPDPNTVFPGNGYCPRYCRACDRPFDDEL